MKILSPEEMMRENLIVKHYAGSHAYGTALPTSDVDFRGVFCAEPVNIRTNLFPVREVDDKTEEDTKFYELAHFMKLCLDCNPNIIETLWVDESDVVFSTDAYQMLREHRQRFLSSKIAFTTSGYAIAQLKRIKGHNKWLNRPEPEEPPKPYQFFSLVQWFGANKMLKLNIRSFNKDRMLVPYGGNVFGVYYARGHTLYDSEGNLKDKFEGNREDLGPPTMIVKWNREVYKEAKEKHNLYWTWKKNRNKARSELEEKFGYDAKFAMHLVRLLRMGVEALRDGEIIVKRPDAQELLDIRSGKWTYEKILAYAEEMDEKVRKYWYQHTDLPKKPDRKFAAQIVMDIQDSIWMS